MIIYVKVKTNAKNDEIHKENFELNKNLFDIYLPNKNKEPKKPITNKETNQQIQENICLFISVKDLAQDNKANFKIIKLLASYFNTQQNRIKILKGKTSKVKMIQILN